MKEKETDTELLARLMAEGFGEVKTRLDGMDGRLDGIDGRLDGIDGRFDGMNGRLDGMDTGFKRMNDRMDGMDARLGVLQSDVVKIKSRLENIQDDLTSALQASDNDGIAILNHEHRVSHLERLGGIKSVPAEHMVGLGY